MAHVASKVGEVSKSAGSVLSSALVRSSVFAFMMAEANVLGQQQRKAKGASLPFDLRSCLDT